MVTKTRKYTRKKAGTKRKYTRRKPIRKSTRKKSDPITSFFDALEGKSDRVQKNVSKIESRLKNINVKKRIAKFKSDRQKEEINRLQSEIAERKRMNEERRELAALKKQAKLLKAEETHQKAISGLSEFRKKLKTPSRLSKFKSFSSRFRR